LEEIALTDYMNRIGVSPPFSMEKSWVGVNPKRWSCRSTLRQGISGKPTSFYAEQLHCSQVPHRRTDITRDVVPGTNDHVRTAGREEASHFSEEFLGVCDVFKDKERKNQVELPIQCSQRAEVNCIGYLTQAAFHCPSNVLRSVVDHSALQAFDLIE
jgi:hypothetical protein